MGRESVDRLMKRVCVFDGDDAAPEAVRPTVDLLEELVPEVEFHRPPVGEHAEQLGAGRLPDPLREAIEGSDTVLFGSASGTALPIIRYLRNEYGGGLPANVRPVRYLPGADSPLADPTGVDYTIVRENLEGLYLRAEGDLEALRASSLEVAGGTRDLDALGEGKYAIRVASEENLRWLAGFACDLAAERAERGAGRLTCATKSNVLDETDGLFQRTVEREATDRGLEYEHLHADDLGQQLAIDPGRFDVIVTPNFAGDLLSDVGAGTVGGLGLAPSGCYGPETAYFEPVHGTAPDIAGENVINPTATLLSAVMLLEYVGRERAADRLAWAVEAVYRAGGPLTPDQGGSASTDEMVAAVAGQL